MLRVLRSKKGFTLIEVIVVAVIIAVLSAVAIPLYNGYIRDSRERTAENVAGSAASFIGTAWSILGSDFADRCKYEVGGSGTFTDMPTTGTLSLSSSGTSAARFVVVNEDTATAIDNYFIIPTDIGVEVDFDDHEIIGYHRLDSAETRTQVYKFAADL